MNQFYAIFAALALAAGAFSTPALAAPKCTDLGLAGLLSHCNSEDLPEITLASGKPLAEAPLNLQSGV